MVLPLNGSEICYVSTHFASVQRRDTPMEILYERAN